MRIVVLEPLAVEKDRLMSIAQEILGDNVDITLYENRTTDPQELIERGKDADIVIEANQPLSVVSPRVVWFAPSRTKPSETVPWMSVVTLRWKIRLP